ncbi:MAG: DUF1071 domain-containing protein [Cyanobacteria bacterium RM1_2_2]|nr:DUF1071 domain-containing protein [Cyanobacteria bacterium RM1_2_2]
MPFFLNRFVFSLTSTATSTAMQTTEPITNPLTPPSMPGEWTLSQIQFALSRPLPKSVLASRRQGGATLFYIPWYTANRILDKYAPGWTWEIRSIDLSSERLFLVGRLTIPTAEGNVYREATGTEVLKGAEGDQRPGRATLFEMDYDRPLTDLG